MVMMTMIAGRGLEKPPSSHLRASRPAPCRRLAGYFPAGCKEICRRWNSDRAPCVAVFPCDLHPLLISSCLAPRAASRLTRPFRPRPQMKQGLAEGPRGGGAWLRAKPRFCDEVRPGVSNLQPGNSGPSSSGHLSAGEGPRNLGRKKPILVGAGDGSFQKRKKRNWPLVVQRRAF